jgi:FkbM family methyltransferase
LIEWCKQFCNKNKIFLDIGAHSGTYTISLAPYCKQVYSFEPQRLTYYTLCGSVALSNLQNVNCMQYGLGSTEQCGIQTLNIISDDGGGSTIHARDNIKSKEEIIIKMLDECNISDISLIKMDVEDNEYYVLLGAKETLKRSNYPKIIFELNNMGVGEKTIALLKEYGYKIHSISGYSNMYLASV